MSYFAIFLISSSGIILAYTLGFATYQAGAQYRQSVIAKPQIVARKGVSSGGRQAGVMVTDVLFFSLWPDSVQNDELFRRVEQQLDGLQKVSELPARLRVFCDDFLEKLRP